MKIDSEKIAEIAGVSRSTVSRVINNSSLVKLETREKILEIIEEFDYVPNKIAQTLAGKRSRVIGIFIYDEKFKENISEERSINLNYYFNFINKSTEVALKNGYQVLVDVISDKEGEKRVEGYFGDGTVSSGIFIGFTNDSVFINSMIKTNHKISLIDFAHTLSEPRDNIFLINTGDYDGAYEVTQKLLNQGLKKIVFVEGIDNKLSAIERKKGYKQALRDHGVEIDESLILKGEYEKLKAKKEMVEFLNSNREFDAIFSSSDNMAVGIQEALLESNADLDNIPLWGFDNLKHTFLGGIRTVSPLLEKTAAEAVKSLIIKGYGTSEVRYTKVEIIENFKKYLEYS